MLPQSNPIADSILRQLAGGEKRILSLVVAMRKAPDSASWGKGELTGRVASALRKLVASKEVVDADGLYSLARSK